jgi:hypothetical protein
VDLAQRTLHALAQLLGAARLLLFRGIHLGGVELRTLERAREGRGAAPLVDLCLRAFRLERAEHGGKLRNLLVVQLQLVGQETQWPAYAEATTFIAGRCKPIARRAQSGDPTARARAATVRRRVLGGPALLRLAVPAAASRPFAVRASTIMACATMALRMLPLPIAPKSRVHFLFSPSAGAVTRPTGLTCGRDAAQGFFSAKSRARNCQAGVLEGSLLLGLTPRPCSWRA